MRSTFAGLEIGRRGLQTHQQTLDIASHNMANASTPGFSRQRAEIVTTPPFTYPSFNRLNVAGQMGTGVDVASVMRIRDQLLDGQINQETTNLGYWEGRRDMLDQMELVVNEPSTSGIREDVDNFWKYLEEFSKTPNNIPMRSTLRQQSISLTDNIRNSYSELKKLRSSANARIVGQVDELNTLSKQIANLNDQIGKITVMGDNPNDLLDSRDALVEKVAKIVDFNSFVDKENRINITIDGRPLVLGAKATELITRPNPSDPEMVEIRWTGVIDEYNGFKPRSGLIKGLTDIRDVELVGMMDDLNTFASTLITKMNEIHRTGYGLDNSTGNDFFSGVNAEDIKISDAIKDDLNKIAAASKKDTPGNNDIALKMAELKQQRIYSNNCATMGDFIASIVSDLGVKSSTAKAKSDTFDQLIGHLNERRESVSGVSLDEEMTDMVKFQHGYNAAAKVISTMDELLDVIINRLKV